MTKTSKTLVFFGSGPVASKSLDFLSDNFLVEAVITKSRPLHHQDPAPVEQLCQSKNLDLYFANSGSEIESSIAQINPKSKCAVVIDYGVIITEQAIGGFDLGILNSHFSLLPEWRGADPITYSLLSGQSQSGVTLMKINQNLDEGQILAQSPIKIATDENCLSLTDRLISVSNALLAEHLTSYIDSKSRLRDQPDQPITYSRKIAKGDGAINWNQPSTIIEREIRAFSGWPGSYGRLGSIDIIITKASLCDIQLNPGQMLTTTDGKLHVGCAVGSLSIEELKPIGKKTMPVAAFLNGYKHQLNQSTH